MKTQGTKNWWFLTINGTIAILFGIMFLFFTRTFIETLIMYFGLIILIGGLILLITAINYLRNDKKAGLTLFESILTIAIGVIIMIFPQNSMNLFLLLIGIWAVIVGLAQLVILINIKSPFRGKHFLLFNGLLTIVLGVFLFFKPYEMSIIIVKIIGLVAIIFGVMMVYFSIALKLLKPDNSDQIEPESEKKIPE